MTTKIDDMGNPVEEVRGVAGHLLLDKSGSMAFGYEATVEAFNGYFEGIKETPDMTFSLHLFDTEGFDTLVENRPVNEMVVLSPDNYVPRGGTPLFDSIAKTILMADEDAKRTGRRPLVVIQTDGQENSSSEYVTRESIKTLIEAKQEEGWVFVFLGVGVDAMAMGTGMGINRGNTITYTYRVQDMNRLSCELVVGTISYAASACSGSKDFTNTGGAGIDMTHPNDSIGVSVTDSDGGNHGVTDDILSPDG
jgi:uncharacterized protein YegL